MWVAGGTALSRITGFLRVFVLAYAIGQSELADVYSLANSAPNLVFELVVGGVLSATLIPLFVGARENHDRESASVLMSVGLVASAILTVLALGLTFGADRWALTRWNELDGEVSGWVQVRSGISFLYLFLPQILFYGITSLVTAYLNAARRYRTAAFAPVLTNIVSIAAFIAIGIRLQGRDDVLDAVTFDASAIYWLGIGTTAGVIAMTIPLLWEMHRSHERLWFQPQFRHPVVRKLLRLSGWTFGYVVANQVALLVVIAMVTDVKRYQDAFIFFQLPHGLIAVSIMTTMTPELASAAAQLDYQAFVDRFVRGLRLLAVLVVPAAVGYVILATPVTSFLARGALTPADARATGTTLAMFAIGLPAFSTYLFACRGFYALSNTRVPFLLNVVENGLNIVGVVGFALIGRRGSASFAFAYSIAYLAAAVLAVTWLERSVRRADPSVVRPDLAPLAKMVAAAAMMGVAVFVTRLIFSADAGFGALLSVIVAVVVGLGTYAAAGTALGVSEIDSTVAALRRRVGRPGRSSEH
ncbi:MAG: hypothetical protein GX868_01175 [Actinobacteria bacterium]|nr:hypothetical protein [Actinomycetota bacterium]